MMKRYPVRGNSHIDRIGHNEKNTVEIRFIDGSPGVYEYWDVPIDIWEGLYNAGDPWTYFQANISGGELKRKGHKVDDVEEEEDMAA